MMLQCELNQGTGAMPLRWCLEASEQETIVAMGSKYSFLVVVDTFYNGQQQNKDRQVLPLEAMMSYVSFRRPGVVRVCVAVVQVKSIDERNLQKAMKEFRERNSDGEVSELVFDMYGDLPGLNYIAEHNTTYEVIAYSFEKIDVPQEYFGAPWPELLMWWATWFPRNLLRRKLIDECDRRRWLMFSIFPQPIILLIWYAMLALWTVVDTTFKLIAAAYLDWVLGMRKIDWGCILDTSAVPSAVWGEASRRWSSRLIENEAGGALPIWQQILQVPLLLLVVGLFALPETLSTFLSVQFIFKIYLVSLLRAYAH